jgi:hypothetical protein
MPLSRREFLATTSAFAILSLHPHHATSEEPNVASGTKNLPAPDWIHSVTRMAFCGPDQFETAAAAGVQVVHTNLIWPYFPLQRDGGGLTPKDDEALRAMVERCHALGMKLSLGLPPFPPVNLIQAHPDWRIHPDDTGSVLQIEPREDNLGTRNPCNNGPWGDYLVEICGELVRDYALDGFSYDGNYHAALCFCPTCKSAYRAEQNRDLPAALNLDDVAYREYLVWRGERLIQHYLRLKERMRAENPNAALMSWTVNAGRYGHFLYSPRAMPAELNHVFDLPMQEWWLDETNQGASVCPAFGAAYLSAAAAPNPGASEAYLMSRGNPYSNDSFPKHERLTRNLLAMTNGSRAAESFGWPGHLQSTADVLGEVARRAEWMPHARPLPWAALLVSEQTRQFYAYRDIADRFLPHVFGPFRAAMEEHLPLSLICDWDLTPERLSEFALLILPNAAALSETQLAAVRHFVATGGGLIATGETSLCDELGRPRGDFALADLFGVQYQGRPNAPITRPELDVNFAVTVDDAYWSARLGASQILTTDHAIFDDDKLRELIPTKVATFKGPQSLVSEPANASEVVARYVPEGSKNPPHPAIILRQLEHGRVAYLPAAIDAALWSYAYPYQRRLFARLLHWAARTPNPITVKAPMCVQASSYKQDHADGERLVIHLMNTLNTTANHGLPSVEVPLREETIPIHDIEITLHNTPYKTFHLEPNHTPLEATHSNNELTIKIPRLELHAILVASN